MNTLDFSLEDEASCGYDRLCLYDGGYRGIVMGCYCGQLADMSWETTSNQLYLVFTSDSTEGDSGFSLVYSFLSGKHLNYACATCKCFEYLISFKK